VIPPDGLVTSEKSVIFRGDGVEIDKSILSIDDFEVIIAGEFIEHIDSPLRFFLNMRRAYPGRELIISTPNGACFANTLLGCIGREVQHHDHLHNFSFKILNTLCLRAGFTDWTIVPYRFYATEMILNSRGLKRLLVQTVEKFIRSIERMFPLLSFGYVVKVTL
jgi:SAM-dependent methyltransferase